MRLKNNVKTGVFFLLNLFSALLPKNRAAILLYHSLEKNDVYLSLAPEIFARQMAYLKEKKYRVVSLTQLVDELAEAKKIIPKTVVLTFDDGFASHFEVAWPVLEKYNFPATFFISLGQVGAQMDNSQKKPQKTMDWPQIKEMAGSSLVDIEPHGLTHQELPKLTPEEALKEIQGSKQVLEKELGKACNFFAPARGTINFEVLKIIRQAGFKAAVSVNEGLVKKGDDPMALKRYTINSSCLSNIQFKARLNWSAMIFDKIFR